MTNAEKQMADQESNMVRSSEERVQLQIELPRGMINRLEILSESYDGDISRVILEALMMLWETRYASVQSISAQEVASYQVSSEPVVTVEAEPSVSGDKRQRIVEMHNGGIPVVDIAREVDWPEESVKRVLGMEVPPPDRELLRGRVRTMQAIGMSLTGIAKQWNKEGVPTLSGQGRWHHSTIKKLIGS